METYIFSPEGNEMVREAEREGEETGRVRTKEEWRDKDTVGEPMKK